MLFLANHPGFSPHILHWVGAYFDSLIMSSTVNFGLFAGGCSVFLIFTIVAAVWRGRVGASAFLALFLDQQFHDFNSINLNCEIAYQNLV